MKTDATSTHGEMSEAVRIFRFENESASETGDCLAVERPLAIRLNYRKDGENRQQALSVTMRTPGQDPALAAGYLFTEGIVFETGHIKAINHSPVEADTVCVTLNDDFTPDLGMSDRSSYMSSSCGLCGKTSLEAIRIEAAYSSRAATIRVQASGLCRLPSALRNRQETFGSTGGIHASALFTPDGVLLDLAEDVGRHNALDKLIGRAFLGNNLPLSETLLLLSGRASFELIQKAAMAGIPVVAAIGAPSSGAVELAAEKGITLVGFLKANRFNCYTHPDRVLFNPGL